MDANLTSLIGKKIRMLTVIRFSHVEQAQHKDRVRNKYMFECLCDCGNTTIVNKANLTSMVSKGSTWSCGCLQKERSLKGHEKQRGVPRPHVQKPNGESILHSNYLNYIRGAKDRGLEFNLTKDEFASLVSKNCYYCDTEPTEKKKKREFAVRKMNGIDRLDSSVGYNLSNCVPCCKICNYMKLELSENEFLNHIKKILAHRGNHV